MKIKPLNVCLGVIVGAGLLIFTAAATVAYHRDYPPRVQAPGRAVRCSNPRKVDAANCRQIEEEILNATIQIRIETWAVKADESGYIIDSSVGHGTLKDGRYLVTHNHFSIPLPIQAEEEDQAPYALVTLSNTQGEIRFKGPLSDFELAWRDPQTLVIAYKENDFLEGLGFVSAEFQEWRSLPLATGMEVARINWDGATTSVDWVTIKEVNVAEDVPRLVLAGDVTSGASGGGVFWQGVHIGNNWEVLQCLNQSGILVDATTEVALDSAEVVSEAYQKPVR